MLMPDAPSRAMPSRWRSFREGGAFSESSVASGRSVLVAHERRRATSRIRGVWLVEAGLQRERKSIPARQRASLGQTGLDLRAGSPNSHRWTPLGPSSLESRQARESQPEENQDARLRHTRGAVFEVVGRSCAADVAS
jgi:hypothetical protein